MNAVQAAEKPAVLIPGAAFGGGFYAGQLLVNGQAFALIASPKAEGEHEDAPWNKSTKMVEDAQSYFDGRTNTAAMAKAGSKLAQWALDLRIGGCDDWYLPSRDELELCYRNLKPSIDENWTHRHGENPSSVPVGYPYTERFPLQTEAEAFQDGKPEAFDAVWYWSSTQSASDSASAWHQHFLNGGQDLGHEDFLIRARAVRRLPI